MLKWKLLKTEVNYKKVFIGIGSNIGNRLQNISKAIELINKNSDCNVLKVSSVFESKAFGVIEQNNFFNSVVQIETNLEPENLLKLLKEIEKEIGRSETERWGPREIDLDILLFDNLVYSKNGLTIPHKGIPERDFVMVPLTEIEPEIVHPVLNKKVKGLIAKVEENIIRKYQ